jgi:hypothetical protein
MHQILHHSTAVLVEPRDQTRLPPLLASIRRARPTVFRTERDHLVNEPQKQFNGQCRVTNLQECVHSAVPHWIRPILCGPTCFHTFAVLAPRLPLPRRCRAGPWRWRCDVAARTEHVFKWIKSVWESKTEWLKVVEGERSEGGHRNCLKYFKNLR